MNLLFVCNQAKHRSRTAAEIYQDDHNTSFAGVYSEERPVTKKLLAETDTVFFMEESQRTIVTKQFPKLSMQKRLITLNIPDVYSYNDKRLIQELQKHLQPYLGE